MKEIFESTQINGMVLKNRIVRSALWMKMANSNGLVAEELIKTYEALGNGGSGLVITGYATVLENDRPNNGMIESYSDIFLEGLSRLSSAIQKGGAKAALQLAVGGSQSHISDRTGLDFIGPSAIENRVTRITPREMSHEDIKHVAKSFGNAAYRAKQAGFDAVQLHAAHGYLLSQFLTPYYNRRSDEYGGAIHNRARIIYEVYKEVRTRVGAEYPILVKINHDDFMDEGEGLTFDEALQVIEHLDSLGVDAFEVSGTNESSGKGIGPARKRISKLENQSYYKNATSIIADRVKAPVILMGGNRNLPLVQEILNSSNIEYFSISRPLLSEPDLPLKWKGNSSYMPRCISCNKCSETTPNSCFMNRR